VASLVAHLPRGATRILVTCAARGCPAKRWTVGTTIAQRRCHHGRCTRHVKRLSTVDLSSRLHRHALAVGGHLNVEVLRSGYTGIVFQITIRASSTPGFSKGCLVTGSRKPVPC
jgi:hypothetical protein